MADKVKRLPLGVNDLTLADLTIFLQKSSDGDSSVSVAGITVDEIVKDGFKTGTYRMVIPEATVTEELYFHVRQTDDESIYVEGLVRVSDGDEAQQSSMETLLGSGDTAVNHNTGGTDNLRAVDGSGSGLALNIEIYLKADYDVGSRGGNFVKGRTRTGDDGRWLYDVRLISGTAYTVVYYQTGRYVSTTKEVTP